MDKQISKQVVINVARKSFRVFVDGEAVYTRAVGRSVNIPTIVQEGMDALTDYIYANIAEAVDTVME